MELNDRKVLICTCERTMALDGNQLQRACRAGGATDVHYQLCRAQLDKFRAAAAAGPLTVACTQEQPIFDEILAEIGAQSGARYVNIRDKAGWSDEGGDALPKIAALLAESAVEVPPTPSVTLKSEGACLVYGRDEQAIDAACRLSARLDVTVLLTRPKDIMPPRVMEVPIFRGTLIGLRGHLGAFELVVDDYAAAVPSSRGRLTFEAPKNGARSRCDLILDLSGGAPLLPRGRDGYLHPDPGDPAAIQRALFDLVDLVGEFEKPRYIDFNAAICAHSRSRKTGCTRCLDLCPASAIRPDGDAVAIDPAICGGCGACHSVCPTGAAAYALPPMSVVGERLRILLGTYHRAGGSNAAILAHDSRHGEDLITAMARVGRGLPARIIPFALNEVTQIGFDFLALALAYGARQIVVLAAPEKQSELAGLAGQVGLAEAMLAGLGFGEGRLHVLVEADPDAVERALYGLPAVSPIEPASFLAMGDKRALIRLALRHLRDVAPAPQPVVALPQGAPFGAVEVAIEGCTLCLACVGACPTGALQDNPEKPQLRFQEDACVQCGLCKATCPENVISLKPRLNFTDAAATALIVKEEEPFHCVRCGKPFGTKSSVDRIVERLASKHSMFLDEGRARLIQMCDTCRITVQFEAEEHPLAGPPRPKPRTTDDYLKERDAARDDRPKKF